MTELHSVTVWSPSAVGQPPPQSCAPERALPRAPGQGHGIWDMDYGTRDTGHRTRDTGHGVRDMGYGTQDTRHSTSKLPAPSTHVPSTECSQVWSGYMLLSFKVSWIHLCSSSETVTNSRQGSSHSWSPSPSCSGFLLGNNFFENWSQSLLSVLLSWLWRELSSYISLLLIALCKKIGVFSLHVINREA